MNAQRHIIWSNHELDYEDWKDNHHMENIWNAVEARANEVVRADFIARKDSR